MFSLLYSVIVLHVYFMRSWNHYSVHVRLVPLTENGVITAEHHSFEPITRGRLQRGRRSAAASATIKCDFFVTLIKHVWQLSLN